MSQPSAGRATSAVLDRYHRELTAHRRRVLVSRGLTVLFILWTIGGTVVLPVLAVRNGTSLPWFASVSPVSVLAVWALILTVSIVFSMIPHLQGEVLASQSARRRAGWLTAAFALVASRGSWTTPPRAGHLGLSGDVPPPTRW